MKKEDKYTICETYLTTTTTRSTKSYKEILKDCDEEIEKRKEEVENYKKNIKGNLTKPKDVERVRYLLAQVTKSNQRKLNLSKSFYKDGNYNITGIKDIDLQISQALRKVKEAFNVEKVNYEKLFYSYIPRLEVFTIKGHRYFIESKENEDGEIAIKIVNYDYGIKYYEELNRIFSNCDGCNLEKIKNYTKNIEKEILTKSIKFNIKGLDKIANAIHNIFNLSIEYHNRNEDLSINYYEINNDELRKKEYDLLQLALCTKSDKRELFKNYNKYRDVIKNEFKELYFSLNEGEMSDLRRFVTSEFKDIKYEIDKLYFQWGYSPLSNEIDNLCTYLDKEYSDKKLNKRKKLTNTSNKPQLTNTRKQGEKTKPKFNPSQFNKYTYNLFIYIQKTILQEVQLSILIFGTF